MPLKYMVVIDALNVSSTTSMNTGFGINRKLVNSNYQLWSVVFGICNKSYFFSFDNSPPGLTIIDCPELRWRTAIWPTSRVLKLSQLLGIKKLSQYRFYFEAITKGQQILCFRGWKLWSTYFPCVGPLALNERITKKSVFKWFWGSSDQRIQTYFVRLPTIQPIYRRSLCRKCEKIWWCNKNKPKKLSSRHLGTEKQKLLWWVLLDTVSLAAWIVLSN